MLIDGGSGKTSRGNRKTHRSKNPRLIYNPIDAKAILPSQQALKKAGIPFIAGLQGPNPADHLAIVQPDYILQGYLAGKKMVEDMKGKGKVILLWVPASLGLYGRAEGFFKAIAPYPEIEIVVS